MMAGGRSDFLYKVLLIIIFTCTLIPVNGIDNIDHTTFDSISRDGSVSCSEEIFHSNRENDCTLTSLNQSFLGGKCEFHIPEIEYSGDWSRNIGELDIRPQFFKRKFKKYPSHMLSGLNISTSIPSNYTTGFLFQMVMLNGMPKSWCQVMDIHQLPRPINDSILVWNKYLFFFDNETNKFFNLRVTELPSGRYRELRSRVPSDDRLDPKTLSEWEAVIFRDFSNEAFEFTALFMPAPSRFIVDSYLVRLLKNENRMEVENRIVDGSGKMARRLTFSGLEPDTNYVVTVQAVCENCENCCHISKYDFLTSKIDRDFTLIFILVSLLALVIMVALGLYLLNELCKPVANAPAVMLYRFDNTLHKAVVDSFERILSRGTFNIIRNKRQPEINPNDQRNWLTSEIKKKENIIIIIWSAGPIEMQNQDDANVEIEVPLQENTTRDFDNQLGNVSRHRLGFSKRQLNYRPIVHVVWDRTNKRKIPEGFRHMPNTFFLPDEWSSFISRLYGHRTKWFGCRCRFYETVLLKRCNALQKCSEYSDFITALNAYLPHRNEVNIELGEPDDSSSDDGDDNNSEIGAGNQPDSGYFGFTSGERSVNERNPLEDGDFQVAEEEADNAVSPPTEGFLEYNGNNEGAASFQTEGHLDSDSNIEEIQNFLDSPDQQRKKGPHSDSQIEQRREVQDVFQQMCPQPEYSQFQNQLLNPQSVNQQSKCQPELQSRQTDFQPMQQQFQPPPFFLPQPFGNPALFNLPPPPPIMMAVPYYPMVHQPVHPMYVAPISRPVGHAYSPMNHSSVTIPSENMNDGVENNTDGVNNQSQS